MRQLPVIKKLPSLLNREIGRVITRFAHLEYILSITTYEILGIGPKEARLAIIEPRMKNRIELIIDLLRLKKIDPNINLSLWGAELEKLENQRNQIAHGVWLQDPKTKIIFLRIISGTWQPIKGQRGKTKRKISPEGLEYNAKDCRLLVSQIDASIKVAEYFHRTIMNAL
jgi:hypothetical protein